jgi:hypothetical protein
MNTREELVQAFEDYKAGRLGTIPAITAVHNTPATIVESGQPADPASGAGRAPTGAASSPSS